MAGHLLKDSSALPDVMNDPQYATNTAGGEDAAGDPDTCRICRGEGSDKEPLFHPCKCSGSIKHVHQDCLMEWLSHSQKKHCELCKTPFRFTKLYSPNMPQSLPPGVFFRHSVLHSVRNIGTWLRFCLVVTVWLGFLPYVIRQVWRLLFWFSDGGWPARDATFDGTRNTTQILEIAQQFQYAASLAGNGTSPVTPLHARPTTPASVGSIWSLLMRFSQTLNITDADPLTTGLFKSIYYGLGISVKVMPQDYVSNTSVSDSIIGTPAMTRTPSLLSGVPFLCNMTRNPYINQLVVTIAEGYVITLLVVVSFILVFLIREWVVQQQFGVNMRAGFNPEFAAPERPRERDQAAPEEPAPPNLPEPREVGQRPMARPRRRNLQFDDTETGGPRRAGNGDARTVHEIGEGSRQHRPAPVRDALAPASEIQRQLTEEPRMTEEFLAIWRRADSDPTEVLRIIEEENKGDEMRYWVNAMKTLKPHPPPDNQRQSIIKVPKSTTAIHGVDNSILDPRESVASGSVGSGPGDVGTQAGSDQSSSSSDSWVDISKPVHNPAEEDITAESHETVLSEAQQHNYDFSSDKGKGKELDETLDPLSKHQPPETLWGAPPSAQFYSLGSGSSRPRAVSDGPQLKENSISLLANNNWSFKNLPHTDAESGPSPSDLFEKPNFGDTAHSFASPIVSGSDASVSAQPSQGRDAWKAAQALRVQEAIERGRETRRALEQPRTPVVTAVPDPDLYGPVEIRGKDGIVRTAQDWDEEFDNNPISDSEDETEANGTVPEPNPFQPDVPLPEVREPVVARPAEAQGLFEVVADWLWGGIDDTRPDEGANDEHIVEDLAAEAPFVPVDNHDLFERAVFAEQDREVAEAAIAAGIDPNDPDAIDEAEDFEGIMELIGMRGPIFSLAQNALFSAFLLALTVAFGVWIPYNIGRVSLLLLANPGPAFKLPLRLVFWCAALLQDLAATLLGVLSYCLIALLLLPVRLWNAVSSDPMSIDTGFAWTSATLRLSNDAMERILHGTVNSLLNFKDSDIFTFSAASHEALLTIGSLVKDTLSSIVRTGTYFFVGEYSLSLSSVWGFLISSLRGAWQLICGLWNFLVRPESWVISLEVSKRATPLNLELSAWNGMDRFWATIAGYTTLSIVGTLYVKKGTPFSNGPVGREWEATVMDLLHQAGGVMKVILIISIEMLVFPLYCGLLLDAALLPLFDNATIMSRVRFTVQSPLTSVFVHWFVGTCYMFHFALFVSMCRKIMRKGVLCEYIPPPL
jgi:E3 ubiquitin-protein ligase MARCH6